MVLPIIVREGAILGRGLRASQRAGGRARNGGGGGRNEPRRGSCAKFEAAMSLGVYIQVPFCRTKCTYCNFHTGVFPQGMYSPYVDSVVREITEHRALYAAA